MNALAAFKCIQVGILSCIISYIYICMCLYYIILYYITYIEYDIYTKDANAFL